MMYLKRFFRPITLFMIALLLFQSCRVYHKAEVSIDKAVSEEKRVRLITKDGQKLKFKRIIKTDNQYYGIKSLKPDAVKTSIDPSNIRSLRLHNQTLSIVFGILIGSVVTTAVITFIALASWSGPSFSGSIMLPM